MSKPSTAPISVNPEDFASVEAAWHAGFHRGKAFAPAQVQIPQSFRPRKVSPSRRIAYEQGMFDGFKARRRSRRLLDRFHAKKISPKEFAAKREEILVAMRYEATLPDGMVREGTPEYGSPKRLAQVVGILERAGKLPDDVRRMLEA